MSMLSMNTMKTLAHGAMLEEFASSQVVYHTISGRLLTEKDVVALWFIESTAMISLRTLLLIMDLLMAAIKMHRKLERLYQNTYLSSFDEGYNW